MADSYQDITGVLLFDGAPVITPIVELFFVPFALVQLAPGDDQFGNAMYIRMCDKLNPTDWDSLADDLRGACVLAGVTPDEDADIASMILTLGARFCTAIDMDLLRRLTGKIDFTGQVDLTDVFNLARQIDDGHNLKAISVMGAYHCGEPRLWHFGGFAQYEDAHVGLVNMTNSLAVDHARLLAQGKVQEAFADMTRNLLLSVKDTGLRAEVATAMLNAICDLTAVQRVPVGADTVEVEHWDSPRYQGAGDPTDPFHYEIDDRRRESGQARITLAPQTGEVHEMLDILVEVGTLPGSTDAVPCCHVSLDPDDLLVSLFKNGSDRLVLRTERDVSVLPTKLPNGEKAFVIR